MLDAVTLAPTVALSREIAVSIKEFDKRLGMYPQFGEPLHPLSTPELVLWIGIASPLTLRYVIDDVHRLVFVVSLPQLLSRRSGD
jgi:hypothetical protein